MRHDVVTAHRNTERNHHTAPTCLRASAERISLVRLLRCSCCHLGLPRRRSNRNILRYSSPRQHRGNQLTNCSHADGARGLPTASKRHMGWAKAQTVLSLPSAEGRSRYDYLLTMSEPLPCWLCVCRRLEQWQLEGTVLLQYSARCDSSVSVDFYRHTKLGVIAVRIDWEFEVFDCRLVHIFHKNYENDPAVDNVIVTVSRLNFWAHPVCIFVCNAVIASTSVQWIISTAVNIICIYIYHNHNCSLPSLELLFGYIVMSVIYVCYCVETVISPICCT